MEGNISKNNKTNRPYLSNQLIDSNLRFIEEDNEKSFSEEAKTENLWLKRFCNNHCKIQQKRDETFFTKQELLKIRQKRPKIQKMYHMKPLPKTPLDQMQKDIRQIKSLIKQL